ncbi:hypothetical protein GCM10009801_46260 [Streptomyces albiaxialis]|uniref:SH3b domain-containing protein n=1 Tax=Streptomyces albiaxialis TaxID=329523 RepID=A0ABP5HVM3_9ACTN
MTAVSYTARAAALVAAGLLAGSGVAAAAPAAHSADTAPAAAPAKPYGVVTASSLNIRQYPSTDSSAKGVLKKGAQVGLDCKVHAQYVSGNTYWYKLRGIERWVSARWVDNIGSVPLCKDKFPTRMNHSDASRNAMG